MPATAVRPIFAAYAPSPLNDASVPPFPGHEADDEDDTKAGRVDLDFECPQHAWSAIGPQAPPDDAPVRFIDGSIKTRLFGSIIVASQRRPVIAAVVSAAGLEIVGRRTERAIGTQVLKTVCLFSNGIDRDEIQSAARVLKPLGFDLRERPHGSVQRDFDGMSHATRGLAMEAMEEAERSVMLADFTKPTLMDGLLERRLARTPTHNVPTVGLVKKQMATYLPPALQEVVYGLKAGERTPAFVLETVQHVTLVNTYVRLSWYEGAAPSYGIVRLTAPLEYVESAHRSDMSTYLSGLAGYLRMIRHRDQGYRRAAISVDPIVRCEDHLHAILPNIDLLLPRLRKLLQAGSG
jgi:hypothetical protein